MQKKIEDDEVIIHHTAKSGLIIMSELEQNVLQVALDHMEEHLVAISSETNVEDKLKACKNLQKAIK